ncbi:MAG: hypothetical protein Q8Q17_02265 [bacterium]|nr:hypothetical protein [bacterium]
MTKEEFDVKSDAKFYERITLGLAVILGLLGVLFVGNGFVNIIDKPADAIFRLVFGALIIALAGDMILPRLPEIDLWYRAMLGEREEENADAD